LGTLLQVANFNGDCFYRDNTNPIGGKCSSFYGNAANDIENIHSCDDLVLTGTSNSRQVFAIYGDPQQGLVSGSGGTNFGIDEYTCDATSSSCRSVKLNDPSDDSDRFGEALGAGDFNNDGYDDLLITAAHLDGGVASKTIYVLRGTDQGITPIGHINSFEPIATTDTSLFPAAEAPTSDDDFGISLSAMYNSRECSSSNTSFKYLSEGPSPRVGFDFTKCDDVIIGAPGRSNNRGSIYSCKATLVPISTPGDNERINGWTCAEHYPNELEVATETTTEVDPARYGFSLLSVENQNGYPLTDTQIIDGGNPDVTGALFVGAPNKTVNGVVQAGAVYGYYVTPILDNHNTGGIQAVLTEGAENGHDVNAQNSVACDATNNNCENQVLVNSPAQSFSNFGYALSHIQSVSGLNQLPHLAVSAPFRDVASVNGGTDIVNAGTIYLFGPDISTFGIDGGAQIFDTQRNGFSSGCTNNCTWYSGVVLVEQWVLTLTPIILVTSMPQLLIMPHLLKVMVVFLALKPMKVIFLQWKTKWMI